MSADHLPVIDLWYGPITPNWQNVNDYITELIGKHRDKMWSSKAYPSRFSYFLDRRRKLDINYALLDYTNFLIKIVYIYFGAIKQIHSYKTCEIYLRHAPKYIYIYLWIWSFRCDHNQVTCASYFRSSEVAYKFSRLSVIDHLCLLLCYSWETKRKTLLQT